MAMIFISHSSHDQEQADRMKQWLESRGFQNIFLDFDKQSGLAPGVDWERTLYQMLERSEAVVIIVTPKWLESKWCFAEYTQARALGKAIFPVIATPIGEQLIAPDIQHVDLLSDREGGLERLSRQLTRVVLDAQGGFTWDNRRPPYPGLLAFEEEDAAIFFGRDDDIRRVIERLNARRAHGNRKLIAILGGSGSGKSSLLRAGVIPRLKRETRNWIVLPPFRPQTRPLQELAVSLALGLGEKHRWREISEKLEAPQAAAHLLEIGRDLRVRREAMGAYVLIGIDQGEELFTTAHVDEANRFLALLSLALTEDNPFLAVMTMRSEFLAQLQFSRFLTARFEEFSLKPMPLARIADIIEGPARVAGITVEKQLVMQAIQDATSADALPLLAFTLRELYDRFGANGDLTFADYMALGDAEFREALDARTGLNPFENSIRRKADEVLRELAPSDGEIAALRDAFSPFLVRVNDAGEYTRRTASFEALPEAALRLVEGLIKGRLLVSHDLEGTRMIEVAHDALLRKWPLLKGWLDNERDLIVGLQRIQPDVEDYEGAPADKRTQLLLAGAKLELARLWLAERPQKLEPRQRDYVQASIAYADRLKHAEAERLEREKQQVARTRRFQSRLAIALSALGFLIAAVAAGTYLLAIGAAERESQLFASKAFQAFEAGYCDRAMRFAVAGLPVGGNFAIWSKEAEQELRKASLDCRLLSRLAEHNEDLSFATFSPDSARVLTTSRDKTARIWDLASGKRLFVLEGHESAIVHGDYDPAQRFVSTASEDRTARLWDASSGRLHRTLAGHGATVWTALFDRQGNRVLTASDDGTARIWRTQDGQLLHTLQGHTDRVAVAIFSGAGNRVATGAYDNTARLWNADDGRLLAELKGHAGPVRAAAFSSDDRILVTTSDDGTVRFWDAQTGAARPAATPIAHSDKVLKVAIDPFARRAASGGMDGLAVVWNIDTGDRIAEFKGHGGEVSDLAFLRDNRIVTVSRDQAVRIWEADTGQLIALLNGHEAAIESIAVSNGQRMIVTAAHDKTARVWDAGKGRSLGQIGKASAPSEALALDATGQRAITGHDDGSVRIWALAEVRLLAPPIETKAGNIAAVAITGNGEFAAAAAEDAKIRLWEAGTGKLLRTLEGHQQPVHSINFSADGRQLLSASQDKRAIVWDVATGHQRHVLSPHGDEVSSGDISFDQSQAVTASLDGKARLWNMSSGALIHTLQGHNDKIWKARFSPDGARVLTIGNDATARIYDSRTGRQLHVLTGHEQPLGSGSFSPDGRFVVTSSDDNTARVWDVETGLQKLVLRGHAGNTLAVSFSHDGRRILTTSRDGTARVWDAEFGGMLLVLRGHRASVGVGAFFKQGAAVVTASQDASIRLWLSDVGPLQPTVATRARFCSEYMPGAREFTSAESNDPVVGGIGRAPCRRTASLRLWR